MRNRTIYTILWSINPILLLFSINDISPTFLFPSLILAPLAVLISMWLLSKFHMNLHRIGYIIFLLTLWFYYYMSVYLLIGRFHIGSFYFSSHWIILPIWSLIIILLASNWVWQRITSPQSITLYLNLFSIILVGFSLYRIATKVIPQYLVNPEINGIIQSRPSLPERENRPDIYYIVLDGYARQDVLEEVYDYDNEGFMQALEEKGFFIADRSQSNYIQTVLSLASSLNMEYISGSTSIIHNHGQLIGMVNNSRVREFLTQFGYQFVAFSTGYYPTDLTNADIYYSPPAIQKSNDLDALVLMNSIMAPFIESGLIKAPITRYSAAQARVKYIFDSLEYNVPSLKSPKLIFAHIVAPHPPIIFDQNGPITPDRPFFLQGARAYPGSIEEYKQSYISDLIYLNKLTIQAIDGILQNSKIPPIIIIQSDHGPDAYMDWNSKINICLKERFSILNAYYLPDGGTSQLMNDISPVNSFAYIFNFYFDTQIRLLVNHQYFATWEKPELYFDASEISQSCDLP